MHGKDVGMEWLNNDPDAMMEPVIIESRWTRDEDAASRSFYPRGRAKRWRGHAGRSHQYVSETVRNAQDVTAPVQKTSHLDPIPLAGVWGSGLLDALKRDKIRNVISLETWA